MAEYDHQKVKIYTGTFRKKNDEYRLMEFVQLANLPDVIKDQVVNISVKPKKLAEGMELVLELSSKSLRVVNWKTMDMSTLKTVTLSDEEALNLLK